MKVDFCCRVFFSYIIAKANFTVSRSGASLLRTSNSNLHVATCLGLRRSCRLVPTSGVRISQFGLGCLHRNKAQHSSCPSPTRGLVGGSCRCAPPPDPLGWLCGGLRRSPVLVRRRTARDSLNASRRARPRPPPDARELSSRARRFACTFGRPCRGSLVCVMVVSCHGE